MYRFSMMFAVVLGVILLGGAYASAEVIAGTSYIQPTSIYEVSSEITSLGRTAVTTINGNGLNTITGGHTGEPGSTADFQTMWESRGVGFFSFSNPADPLPAYIIFNLGANYNLTGAHVWNYNAGADFANYCGGCKNVTVSVASTDTGTPTFTPVTSLEFDQASGLEGDLGKGYAITASNVRLVRFDITSVYDGAGAYQLAGLAEVRFTGTSTPAPEPSTVVLLATGVIGLLCYAWRKRK